MGWKIRINLLLTFNTLCNIAYRCSIRIWLLTLNVKCKCNDAIIGSNSIVSCLILDEELTMHSCGFSQRCAEAQPIMTQSARFKQAIIGSGQIFNSIEKFHDAIYLMSLAGSFHYKFKRNSLHQTMVICKFEPYPWKIITRTMGTTPMVQVHTFMNIHNHFVDDASLGYPVVRTK